MLLSLSSNRVATKSHVKRVGQFRIHPRTPMISTTHITACICLQSTTDWSRKTHCIACMSCTALPYSRCRHSVGAGISWKVWRESFWEELSRVWRHSGQIHPSFVVSSSFYSSSMSGAPRITHPQDPYSNKEHAQLSGLEPTLRKKMVPKQ